MKASGPTSIRWSPLLVAVKDGECDSDHSVETWCREYKATATSRGSADEEPGGALGGARQSVNRGHCSRAMLYHPKTAGKPYSLVDFLCVFRKKRGKWGFDLPPMYHHQKPQVNHVVWLTCFTFSSGWVGNAAEHLRESAFLAYLVTLLEYLCQGRHADDRG